MISTIKASKDIQNYWLQDNIADIYDSWLQWADSNEPAGMITDIIKDSVPNRKIYDLKILDCACGTGNPSIALTKIGFRNIISSDGSSAMLKKARSNGRRNGISLKTPDDSILWNELPQYWNEYFDVVLLTGNSITHINPDNLANTFHSLRKVLRPGGIFIVDIKRYNSTSYHELSFEDGWTINDRRETYGINSDGSTTRMVTFFEYLGEDVPGRPYNINLEVYSGENGLRRLKFPVWANSDALLCRAMKKAGFPSPVKVETGAPDKWKYDLCVGVKHESF